eukprot:TRINITY_DN4916_c0_g2_i1.p1 TRINITY_DN4916_c0_g2~~TRINITY_DN4916_c0_g2_i1.p1  ORF type:complete len:773 (+),score=140.99 TRINITY_DN4916_c0_g2_i1:354-2672(+)
MFYYQSMFVMTILLFSFFWINPLWTVFLFALLCIGVTVAPNTEGLLVELLFSRYLFWFYLLAFVWRISCSVNIKRQFLMYRSVKMDSITLEKEKNISEKLLLNILPVSVIDRVKLNNQVADGIRMCTVIFAKIIVEDKESNDIEENSMEGFHLLNRVFTAIDNLVSKYNNKIEKIKTITNCYMAVAGVPILSDQHCENAASFSLDLLDLIENFSSKSDKKIRVCIGLNSGACIAGLVGSLKTIYDLWGDTCNVSSRMQSNCPPGKINCSEIVYDQLKNNFLLEDRGIQHIKGKGEMRTFFLLNKLSETIKSDHDYQENTTIPAESVEYNSVKEIDADPSVLHLLFNGSKYFRRFTQRFKDPDYSQKFAKHYGEFSRLSVAGGYAMPLLIPIIGMANDVRFLHGKTDKIIYAILRVFSVIAFITLLVYIKKGKRYVENVQIHSFIFNLFCIIPWIILSALVDPIFYWEFTYIIFIIRLLRSAMFYELASCLLCFVLFQVAQFIPGTLKLDSSDYIIATFTFSISLLIIFLGHYSFEFAERKDFLVNLIMIEQRKQIELEKAKSEKLLYNILPAPIIEALKISNKQDPKSYHDVTILWSDIVGFTDFCSTKSPSIVVTCLNTLFSVFDKLIGVYELEKIKTVGDAYVVAGGLFMKSADHSQKVVKFAFAMLESLQEFNKTTGMNIDLRIGIHSGGCIAGILGIKKFTYELIGEAVSVANLLESKGQPGKILISESVKRSIPPESFLLQPHESVKSPLNHGEETIKTYFARAKFV